MHTNEQLLTLIKEARELGAHIETHFEAFALIQEDREVITAVRILDGIPDELPRFIGPMQAGVVLERFVREERERRAKPVVPMSMVTLTSAEASVLAEILTAPLETRCYAEHLRLKFGDRFKTALEALDKLKSVQ